LSLWPDFPSPGARPRDPTSGGPKEKPDNEPDKTKAARFRGRLSVRGDWLGTAWLTRRDIHLRTQWCLRRFNCTPRMRPMCDPRNETSRPAGGSPRRHRAPVGEHTADSRHRERRDQSDRRRALFSRSEPARQTPRGLRGSHVSGRPRERDRCEAGDPASYYFCINPLFETSSA
jgi:hypothetical protein